MQSRRWVLQGSVAGLAALACRQLGAQTLPPLNPKLTGDLYPIHDPCIIRAGDSYYVFCTTPRADAPAQIPCYTSADLLHWERAGHVFAELPAWAMQAVPHTETLWAPDISFFNDQYWLYYACSTFGSNRSVIGLATTPTLNPADPAYHWQDRGLVLESNKGDDFNALDPNRVIDRDGKHWLAFGSFWTGLKIIPLDPATGMPLPGAQRQSLARRPGAPDAIEAVFIIQRAGNYYLFASFDFCCRGANSSYYTVVGRSKNILRALAAAPTRTFTREELLREVWGFRSMGTTRTLDSHASRLRRKLAVGRAVFVINVWGIGYRLLDGEAAS